MPYRAVFLDLDGTSLTSKHELSPALIDVLKELMSRGVEVVFSTGRSFVSSRQFADQLGGCHYIINYNGAYVHNFVDNSVVSETSLPYPIVKKVLAFAKKHNNSPIFFHDDAIYSFDDRLPSDIYKGEQFIQLNDQTDWENTPFTKALFIIPEDEIESMRQEAIRYFTDATIVTSADNYLEVNPQGVDKANGVKAILKKINLSPTDAIAFGNQLNDTGMLKAVAQGYVMDNSPDLLKEKLPQENHIGSNDDDAVAKKLDEIFKLHYFK